MNISVIQSFSFILQIVHAMVNNHYDYSELKVRDWLSIFSCLFHVRIMPSELWMYGLLLLALDISALWFVSIIKCLSSTHVRKEIIVDLYDLTLRMVISVLKHSLNSIRKTSKSESFI
ncbi:hypothetical protein BSQ97_09775 [Serratia proteamaculans]|nr:hypothetical protein BSQ96_19080 [Serratia proteamaculans]RYM53260.1 hypothetical protein BSQ97_09775 [Serratia proteamaculans]